MRALIDRRPGVPRLLLATLLAAFLGLAGFAVDGAAGPSSAEARSCNDTILVADSDSTEHHSVWDADKETVEYSGLTCLVYSWFFS